MYSQFQKVIKFLLNGSLELDSSLLIPLTQTLNSKLEDAESIYQALNAAFIIALIGKDTSDYAKSVDLLNQMSKSGDWRHIARFYQNGLNLIEDEIKGAIESYPEFAHNLFNLANQIDNIDNIETLDNASELYWSVFFPEGFGILTNPEVQVNKLRKKRKVEIDHLNMDPIKDPAREILFTSNVLLTLPQDGSSLEHIALSDQDIELINKSTNETQKYWYDHPIQIDVPIENNEVVYGLRGLSETLEYEQSVGRADPGSRLTCLLSVSVTHEGLGKIANNYLTSVLTRASGIRNIDVFIFTDNDTQNLLREIFIPAANHYLGIEDSNELSEVFGVNGPYGRHYSFLKAISVFWSILIQPDFKGTYKIDLDQVFPQKELLKYTSGTAFDHLRTPLWGAVGSNTKGNKVHLGMIAGALVNEKDISNSIFTPDVKFPEYPKDPEDYIFYSKLPQALSTQAEMMTRYEYKDLDGRNACLQRVHVTGGTNGILIDSLMQYRPFTPTFIGRAEDQAYILSVLNKPQPILAYAHESGLIMRHDKEVFAQSSIQSAKDGTMIGDYLRVLYFSAYARMLNGDIYEIKSLLDPFTGCFITPIPITIAYLRFSLQAVSLFNSGKSSRGIEFVQSGSSRISDAIAFTDGEDSPFIQRFEIERTGWDQYYDVLQAIDNALEEGDEYAFSLRIKAMRLAANCLIKLP